MLQFKHPGIYTQEKDSGVRSIAGAPTSVACFVGPTPTGIDGRRVRVLNFGDFQRNFGGLSQKSSLSYSILHFFANGGGEAHVIRVPAEGATKARIRVKRNDSANTDQALELEALSSGRGGANIFVEFDPFEIDAKPYTTDYDKKRFNLSLYDSATTRAERFGDLSMLADNARFAGTVASDEATGSKLVKLAIPTAALGKEGPRPTGSIYEIGNVPTGGKFSKDVKLRLTVAVPDADGTAVTVLDKLVVTVFLKNDPNPHTAQQVVATLASRINDAIRNDAPSKELMEGFAVEAHLFERGRLFRLRTSSPAGENEPSKRLAEAMVTITDPTATDTGISFLADEQYKVGTKVEGPSRYRLGSKNAAGQIFDTPVAGADGTDFGQPKTADFKAAISALEQPDPFFNILCLPDLVRPSATDPQALFHTSAAAIYDEAARICALKHAFLLIDPPPNAVDVGSAEAWKTLSVGPSTHAAAYFPNIRVDDELAPGTIRSHPPSGALAGVYARTDANIGVWQAPAGTEAFLAAVYGPAVLLSDEEHGVLNPIAVNVIRKFPIYQTVSFGSRTIDGSNAKASQWKYIPVRRTASYILRSLSEGLRWAVHKPNGEHLWADLRMNVTSFMHGMFRQGAFKGVSAREAYFVQCDSSTTSADDIEQGVVNIVIGFAPLKPAEFVVITLKQIVKPAV